MLTSLFLFWFIPGLYNFIHLLVCYWWDQKDGSKHKPLSEREQRLLSTMIFCPIFSAMVMVTLIWKMIILPYISK